ncbi:MIF4-like type 1/2/3 [Penicillium cf. griseofulvum]|uniref:MIF4-like type 1/2/3 n=1 Tax=Penicillium cf. griseofulvum TaxID=2972120 RepID=A0A9W9JFJ0_9EURO|nr:MIF4-like type 1/2/3 [Penicillium cf. griseofulvum]
MSSNPPQSGNQGQSTATPAASTQPASSTPLAATQAPARSYANATKKSATDSTAAPVTVGGSAQHGQSSSVSVNGKPMQNQSQSASSGVTIVNGAPTASAAPSGDHSRKPSVTITSSGTSGYMPNGGGPASRPNSLQFGFQQSSPNMGAPAVPASNQAQAGLGAPSTNPRVTSPQTSPSPIPQPASSGGRPPPSTYQAQGNVPNFGSFGEAVDPSIAHGPQHLRRESSQSTHSDMSNHMGSGPGRSGYQGGRGRGYSQPGYQGQQMPYSPNPGFRQTPNQPRGGPNMGPQFHGSNQGRPLAPYPNSPHQANRSPALANVNPTTPQMNQVPMAHPQMPQQPYGYGQHMGPQAVRSPPSRSSQDSWRRPQRNLTSSWRRKDNPPCSPEYPVDLAPESGQFEQILTMVKFQQSFPNAYDPNYAGYYNPNGGYYMGPPSPQPRAAGMPYNPQYMGQQFPNPMPQATPLSRTPSQVSTDRPGSSLGQGAAPTGPAVASHTHTGSRASNSPAPKPHFIIPSAKKSPIIIKDPNSGSVKTFEKNPASPARATPSPVNASEHTRTESKANATKTDEEKKQELKDAVRMKIQQDEAAQKQRLADEASRKTEAASTDAKKDDTESARAAIEDLSIKEKAAPVEEPKKTQTIEEPKEAAPAEEPKKAPAPAPAPAPVDDEPDYDAIERELAEIEAKEAAAEADYNRAKQAKQEEEKRKEREELENYEANMKKAEAEAEAREIARENAARAGGDSATQDDSKNMFASLKKGGFSATESSTPGDSGAATPSSDMGPPPKPASAIPKKPAGLKLDTPKPTEPLQATAGMKSLQNAKFLEDLSKVTYPPSINPPDAAMNAAAPEGRKFHYDRDFLLQFQAAFKDKISVDWDSRLRDTVGDPTDSSRPQSARTPSMGSRAGSRNSAMGTPFSGATAMGSFNAPTGRPGQMPPMGSGPMGSRNASGFQFGRGGAGGMGPMANIRTTSQGVPPRGNSSKGPRTDSRQSKKHGGRQDVAQDKSMPLTAGMDLKAIQTSATGWKPRSVGQAAGAGPAPGGEGYLAPDVVQRKVKAALNKMTPEKFDRISGQILDIVSQSKDESDGRTLRQVIQLTFEKATDEAHWAPMYAKFCKSMLESMSPEIKDENIRDRNGTVVAGGSLFRKYLLNRCQEEFERGWKTNLPDKPEGTTEEVQMLSDEYYIAAAAKRRGLGLVKFIGELYKLGMLTERIMHECVKKLVDYEGVPDEAEVESLTSLLRTIGASLDASEKGPAMMDAYFARIHMMIETPNLPSRLRFMLLDIIDLRAARWNSKDSDKGPQTIVEIREAAARAQQAAEAERQRQSSNRGGGGRIPMGRGDARGFGYGNQAPPPDYASSKVGSDDLRRLRATRNTNQPMSFGPSSLLGSRTNSGRKNLGPGGSLVRGSDDSAASSRTGTPTGSKKEDNSSMNAFSALAALEDRDNMATSPPSNPTSPVLTKTHPATTERRPSKTPSVKDGEPTA